MIGQQGQHISATLSKGTIVSASFTGTFSISILWAADEHSSVTIASMVTSSATGKEAKNAAEEASTG
jgi:hypothetical protein